PRRRRREPRVVGVPRAPAPGADDRKAAGAAGPAPPIPVHARRRAIDRLRHPRGHPAREAATVEAGEGPLEGRREYGPRAARPDRRRAEPRPCRRVRDLERGPRGLRRLVAGRDDLQLREPRPRGRSRPAPEGERGVPAGGGEPHLPPGAFDANVRVFEAATLGSAEVSRTVLHMEGTNVESDLKWSNVEFQLPKGERPFLALMAFDTLASVYGEKVIEGMSGVFAS